MDKSKRVEIKVGAFVALGLILLATLLLQFSKSTSILEGTYQLRLHATGVGGIKPRAQVLLAGVQVGIVSDIKLADDSKSVTIFLSIYKQYKIYHDARFLIETAGFLGDQYVSVVPTANTGGFLANGDDVPCEEPFDLQEAARSAAGFIHRLDETAKKLDASVSQFQRLVFNEHTLTNFDVALNNLRTVSDQAVATVNGIDDIVATNRGQVDLAVSNLVYFSHQLNTLADSADVILATNGAAIQTATKNIADSTESLKQVVNDVQAGKGLAGTLLQNETLSSNVQAIASNLAETTSNLNQVGLWGVLWARKPHHTEDTNAPAESHRPAK